MPSQAKTPTPRDLGRACNAARLRLACSKPLKTSSASSLKEKRSRSPINTGAIRYEISSNSFQAGSQPELITQRYGYDPVERLAQIKYIKAEGTGSEQLIEQIDYSYDAAGRRTSKTALNNNGMGASETPMTATYDAANRMSQISLNIAGATKTYALTYDTNGNLIQKQNTAQSTDKTNYTWDASNRLSQIAQTGATQANSLNASFTYDAFGRRIQSSISKAGQAAQTVQYLYEGAQSLGEIRNGSLSHRLLTGLSLDETIARIAINSSGQKDSAASRIYLTDALNSVIAQLSDDNSNPGQLQNSYGYSPYGETITVGPDNTNNPIQYTSRENDGTGLMFYRARYYDPIGKVFVSRDPIGQAGGPNEFAYVHGNPLSYSDPTGLEVQLRCRPADIALGLVDHCWLKTDTTEAGMNETTTCSRAGNDASGYPGMPVVVSDHSCDKPTKVTPLPDVNEQCVNNELRLGKPLGLFLPPANSCQTFTQDVIQKCSTNPASKPYIGYPSARRRR